MIVDGFDGCVFWLSYDVYLEFFVVDVEWFLVLVCGFVVDVVVFICFGWMVFDLVCYVGDVYFYKVVLLWFGCCFE